MGNIVWRVSPVILRAVLVLLFSALESKVPDFMTLPVRFSSLVILTMRGVFIWLLPSCDEDWV